METKIICLYFPPSPRHIRLSCWSMHFVELRTQICDSGQETNINMDKQKRVSSRKTLCTWLKLTLFSQPSIITAFRKKRKNILMSIISQGKCVKVPNKSISSWTKTEKYEKKPYFIIQEVNCCQIRIYCLFVSCNLFWYV